MRRELRDAAIAVTFAVPAMFTCLAFIGYVAAVNWVRKHTPDMAELEEFVSRGFPK